MHFRQDEGRRPRAGAPRPYGADHRFNPDVCWSRALSNAIRTLLSTRSRLGAWSPAKRRARLGNEALVHVTVKLLAGVRWQTLDAADRPQERILVAATCKGVHSRPNGLGLGPPSSPRPSVKAIEVGLVEKHLT